MGKLFVVLLAGVYSKEYEKKAEQSSFSEEEERVERNDWSVSNNY